MFPAMYEHQDNRSLLAETTKFTDQGMHLAWFVGATLVVELNDHSGVTVLVYDRPSGLTGVVGSDADPPPRFRLAYRPGLWGQRRSLHMTELCYHRFQLLRNKFRS